MSKHLWIRLGALAFALLLCQGVTAQEKEGGEAVKPVESWTGTIEDAKLKDKAPKKGFAQNKREFGKLWKDWGLKDEMPSIDFRSNLVLIGIVDGPNKASLSIKTDDEGNVTFLTAGTKKGGPGFGYTLAQIKRKGVRTVNGTSLRKSSK